MPRGNPENLRAAARRKSEAATERTEAGLKALVAEGEPITFRGLARTAGVSIDFLYRSPLRARVEELRAEQQRTPPAPRGEKTGEPTSQSNVVRALTAQLGELRRRHREELAQLEEALAAAQGENLELRRRLGRTGTAVGELTGPAPPAPAASR